MGRYKFTDLYPCSASELKAVGYKDVSQVKLATISQDSFLVPSTVPIMKDEADGKSEYSGGLVSPGDQFQNRGVQMLKKNQIIAWMIHSTISGSFRKQNPIQ